MEFRRLTADDAAAFRRVRLEGLQNFPEAFVADFRTDAARPLSYFAAQLKDLPNNFVIGAFAEDALIGIGGFVCDERTNLRHKGMIWGMYVVPGHRGKGVGWRIVKELIATAAVTASHMEQINIIVAAVNTRARDLYLSMGFQTWGRERHAMLIDGNYYDGEHMVLFLKA